LFRKIDNVAVHFGYHRRFGQTGANLLGEVERRGTLVQGAHAPIRKFHFNHLQFSFVFEGGYHPSSGPTLGQFHSPQFTRFRKAPEPVLARSTETARRQDDSSKMSEKRTPVTSLTGDSPKSDVWPAGYATIGTRARVRSILQMETSREQL